MSLHLRGELGAACLVAAWITVSGPALAAGGSYAVDDASVTPERWCQVESWVREFDPHALELSTAPACTRNGVEYGFTATRVTGDGTTAFSPGVKWVSGDMWWKRWSVGVAAQATVIDGKVESGTIYVPASVALGASQRAQLHVNLGWIERRRGGSKLLQGLGVELRATSRLDALAEYLRTGSDAQLWQLGLRWNAGDTVNVDLVRGRQFGDDSTFWWTLGVNVAFEPR